MLYVPKWNIVLPPALAAIVTLAADVTFARGGDGKFDDFFMPTDSKSAHNFQANPASFLTEGLGLGLSLGRSREDIELDQSADGRDTLKTGVDVERASIAWDFDLGSGLILGVDQEMIYRKNISKTSLMPDVDLEEFHGSRGTSLKVLVELTAELRAAMVMSYVFHEWNILGNHFLDSEYRSRIKTTLAGYGAGAVYSTSRFGISYAYFPPLRGKSDVQGEEKIIIEPGKIFMASHYQINPALTIGLSLSRGIHELDDRRLGTTASDDETQISLKGLSLDQYYFPQQKVALGLDTLVNKQLSIRAAIGQEEGDFNFRDQQRISRLGVSQRESEHQSMTAREATILATLENADFRLLGGVFWRQGEQKFPENMGSGVFKVQRRHIFIGIISNL